MLSGAKGQRYGSRPQEACARGGLTEGEEIAAARRPASQPGPVVTDGELRDGSQADSAESPARRAIRMTAMAAERPHVGPTRGMRPQTRGPGLKPLT